MTLIYLDNNATTRVAPEVFEAMLPYLTESYGNPSSVHQVGTRASVALKEAREKTAAFLHCREPEVTFTSCGTESNNAAIRGVLDATPGKRHIVTTRVEHPSVLELCTQLESQGYSVSYVGVDGEGRLDLAALLGGTAKGKTAYVFIPFDLDAGQDLTFGFGADWWFQAWLDGR